MPRNGAGAMDISGADFTNGTLADANDVMTKFNDIESALTASIAKDGQTTPTAALPMGGFNHTNVGVATARTHYARASQIADGALTYGGVAGGTADALTLTLSPAITAYVKGMSIDFVSGASPNTGAVTATVNGVGIGAVTWPDGTALAGGDIPANAAMRLIVAATTPVFHLQTQTGSLLNINGLTAETAIATGDALPIYDASATANRKITFQNVMNGVNVLTAETTVDPANDYIPLYDASGSATDKATPTSILNGVLTTQGDLMVRDGTSATRLATGTAGYGLVAGGAGVNLAWANNAVRAHACFNGTGTPAFRGTPYNVTSITDSATGSWALNFTTALPSVNYTPLVSSNVSSGNSQTVMNLGAVLTTSIAIVAAAMNSGDATLLAADPGVIAVACIGG